MTKLKALKGGGVQREEKRKGTCFVNWKAYFSSCYFLLLLLFICNSKMISRAWGSTPITFASLKMKHTLWRSKEMIRDRQFYPPLIRSEIHIPYVIYSNDTWTAKWVYSHTATVYLPNTLSKSVFFSQFPNGARVTSNHRSTLFQGTLKTISIGWHKCSNTLS